MIARPKIKAWMSCVPERKIYNYYLLQIWNYDNRILNTFKFLKKTGPYFCPFIKRWYIYSPLLVNNKIIWNEAGGGVQNKRISSHWVNLTSTWNWHTGRYINIVVYWLNRVFTLSKKFMCMWRHTCIKKKWKLKLIILIKDCFCPCTERRWSPLDYFLWEINVNY